MSLRYCLPQSTPMFLRYCLSIRCILGDIRLWVGDPSSRRVENLFDIFLYCVPPPHGQRTLGLSKAVGHASGGYPPDATRPDTNITTPYLKTRTCLVPSRCSNFHGQKSISSLVSVHNASPPGVGEVGHENSFRLVLRKLFITTVSPNRVVNFAVICLNDYTSSLLVQFNPVV